MKPPTDKLGFEHAYIDGERVGIVSIENRCIVEWHYGSRLVRLEMSTQGLSIDSDGIVIEPKSSSVLIKWTEV